MPCVKNNFLLKYHQIKALKIPLFSGLINEMI